MSESIPQLSDECKALAEACNEKHVRVVQAILSGDFDSNTAAYLSVYTNSSEESARRDVSRLLTIADNKALMKALREESLLEGVMTRAELMKRLTSMVRTDMSDLITFGSRTFESVDEETGEPKSITVGTWDFLDSKELTPEAIASISEIASTKEGVKLKIHDAKVAGKQLAEMAGWNKPTELKITGTLKSIPEDASLQDAAQIYADNLKADGAVDG